MTVKSSFAEVNLDVEPGAQSPAVELDPDAPFRILLMGDFSGKGGSEWKAVEIDRDNFDKVMETISPNMDIKGIDGLSGNIAFKKLDHFEPDYLVEHVTGLDDLFKQRKELRDLMAKIDGNDRLYKALSDQVKSDPTFATWGVKMGDAPAPAPAPAPKPDTGDQPQA